MSDMVEELLRYRQSLKDHLRKNIVGSDLKIGKVEYMDHGNVSVIQMTSE